MSKVENSDLEEGEIQDNEEISSPSPSLRRDDGHLEPHGHHVGLRHRHSRRNRRKHGRSLSSSRNRHSRHDERIALTNHWESIENRPANKLALVVSTVRNISSGHPSRSRSPIRNEISMRRNTRLSKDSQGRDGTTKKTETLRVRNCNGRKSRHPYKKPYSKRKKTEKIVEISEVTGMPTVTTREIVVEAPPPPIEYHHAEKRSLSVDSVQILTPEAKPLDLFEVILLSSSGDEYNGKEGHNDEDWDDMDQQPGDWGDEELELRRVALEGLYNNLENKESKRSQSPDEDEDNLRKKLLDSIAKRRNQNSLNIESGRNIDHGVELNSNMNNSRGATITNPWSLSLIPLPPEPEPVAIPPTTNYASNSHIPNVSTTTTLTNSVIPQCSVFQPTDIYTNAMIHGDLANATPTGGNLRRVELAPVICDNIVYSPTIKATIINTAAPEYRNNIETPFNYGTQDVGILQSWTPQPPGGYFSREKLSIDQSIKNTDIRPVAMGNSIPPLLSGIRNPSAAGKKLQGTRFSTENRIIAPDSTQSRFSQGNHTVTIAETSRKSKETFFKESNLRAPPPVLTLREQVIDRYQTAQFIPTNDPPLRPSTASNYPYARQPEPFNFRPPPQPGLLPTPNCTLNPNSFHAERVVEMGDNLHKPHNMHFNGNTGLLGPVPRPRPRFPNTQEEPFPRHPVFPYPETEAHYELTQRFPHATTSREMNVHPAENHYNHPPNLVINPHYAKVNTIKEPFSPSFLPDLRINVNARRAGHSATVRNIGSPLEHGNNHSNSLQMHEDHQESTHVPQTTNCALIQIQRTPEKYSIRSKSQANKRVTVGKGVKSRERGKDRSTNSTIYKKTIRPGEKFSHQFKKHSQSTWTNDSWKNNPISKAKRRQSASPEWNRRRERERRLTSPERLKRERRPSSSESHFERGRRFSRGSRRGGHQRHHSFSSRLTRERRRSQSSKFLMLRQQSSPPYLKQRRYSDGVTSSNRGHDYGSVTERQGVSTTSNQLQRSEKFSHQKKKSIARNQNNIVCSNKPSTSGAHSKVFTQPAYANPGGQPVANDQLLKQDASNAKANDSLGYEKNNSSETQEKLIISPGNELDKINQESNGTVEKSPKILNAQSISKGEGKSEQDSVVITNSSTNIFNNEAGEVIQKGTTNTRISSSSLNNSMTPLVVATNESTVPLPFYSPIEGRPILSPQINRVMMTKSKSLSPGALSGRNSYSQLSPAVNSYKISEEIPSTSSSYVPGTNVNKNLPESKTTYSSENPGASVPKITTAYQESLKRSCQRKGKFNRTVNNYTKPFSNKPITPIVIPLGEDGSSDEEDSPPRPPANINHADTSEKPSQGIPLPPNFLGSLEALLKNAREIVDSAKSEKILLGMTSDEIINTLSFKSYEPTPSTSTAASTSASTSTAAFTSASTSTAASTSTSTAVSRPASTSTAVSRPASTSTAASKSTSASTCTKNRAGSPSTSASPEEEVTRKKEELQLRERLLKATLLKKRQASQLKLKLTSTENKLISTRTNVTNTFVKLNECMEKYNFKTTQYGASLEEVKKLQRQLESAIKRMLIVKKSVTLTAAEVRRQTRISFPMRNTCKEITKSCQEIGEQVAGAEYKVPNTGETEMKNMYQKTEKHLAQTKKYINKTKEWHKVLLSPIIKLLSGSGRTGNATETTPTPVRNEGSGPVSTDQTPSSGPPPETVERLYFIDVTPSLGDEIHPYTLTDIIFSDVMTHEEQLDESILTIFLVDEFVEYDQHPSSQKMGKPP